MTPIDAEIVADYVRRNGDVRPARPVTCRVEDRRCDDDGPGFNDEGMPE